MLINLLLQSLVGMFLGRTPLTLIEGLKTKLKMQGHLDSVHKTRLIYSQHVQHFCTVASIHYKILSSQIEAIVTFNSIAYHCRDLSNGYIVAEIFSWYYPQAIQMHNYYTNCTSLKTKQLNWDLLLTVSSLLSGSFHNKLCLL